MKRLAYAVLFALTVLTFSAPGALAADDPQVATSEKTPTQRGDKATAPSRRRLSTEERWRGRPYLRSRENDALRAQALGRALPAGLPGSGNGGPAISLRPLEVDTLRNRALDMALPLLGAGPQF